MAQALDGRECAINALVRPRGRDEDGGPAVPQPVFEGVRAEQVEQRQRDRAALLHRDVSNDAFRALRQMNAADAAAADAEMLKHACEPACSVLDLGKGPGADRAGLLLVDQGTRRWLASRVPAADRLGDVEARRNVPAECPADRVITCAPKVHARGLCSSLSVP